MIPQAKAFAPTAMVQRNVRPHAVFLLTLALSAALDAQGPDLLWSNSAGTEQWNDTDASWSGAKWAHSPSNHAFTSAVGGRFGLDESVTAGCMNFGGTTYNAPGLTLTNGSLVATGMNIQGKSDRRGRCLCRS